MGDRLANLQIAVQMLSTKVKVVAQSPIYSTPPWGYEDQPDFLNQVVLIKTSQRPEDLLKFIKEIEVQVGRTPSFRFGPRVVDLDILFYGDQIVKLPGLEIPHPRLHHRAFVLVPLNDLNPELRHPILGANVQELVRAVDSTVVRQISV